MSHKFLSITREIPGETVDQRARRCHTEAMMRGRYRKLNKKGMRADRRKFEAALRELIKYVQAPALLEWDKVASLSRRVATQADNFRAKDAAAELLEQMIERGMAVRADRPETLAEALARTDW